MQLTSQDFLEMLREVLNPFRDLWPEVDADELTLLDLTSSIPQGDNRHLYESTAQEIFRIMRKNPQAEIVVAIKSFDTGDGFCCEFTHTAAGDIHVWLNPVYRADPVSKMVLDQLLADGIVEKVGENSVGIYYKLKVNRPKPVQEYTHSKGG